ncbi:hypothetical protein TRVL_01832 [Trypanosoma vivax]|nr:hypothetical protein TRVL_01832 [Trypanosoma vivax]
MTPTRLWSAMRLAPLWLRAARMRLERLRKAWTLLHWADAVCPKTTPTRVNGPRVCRRRSVSLLLAPGDGAIPSDKRSLRPRRSRTAGRILLVNEVPPWRTRANASAQRSGTVSRRNEANTLRSRTCEFGPPNGHAESARENATRPLRTVNKGWVRRRV